MYRPRNRNSLVNANNLRGMTIRLEWKCALFAFPRVLNMFSSNGNKPLASYFYVFSAFTAVYVNKQGNVNRGLELL